MRDLEEVLADLVAARTDLDATPTGGTDRRLELDRVFEDLRIEAQQIREVAYPPRWPGSGGPNWRN